jgi:hypothetical protein
MPDLETTYAFELDFNTDSAQELNNPENFLLTIRNIESFFNYRTIESFDSETGISVFKLFTSVLSNKTGLLEIEKSVSAKTQNTYTVLNETIFEDAPLSLNHLHAKKYRIESALKKIEHQANPPASHSLFVSPSAPSESDSGRQSNEQPTNQFCKTATLSSKKPACIECKQLCLYRIEAILDPINCLTISETKNELKLHKHPASRKLILLEQPERKRERTADEARRELADHYIHAHNFKEPVFLS